VCVCVFVFVCVCESVCVFVCVCVYIVCLRALVRLRACVRACVCAKMCTHARRYTYNAYSYDTGIYTRNNIASCAQMLLEDKDAAHLDINCTEKKTLCVAEPPRIPESKDSSKNQTQITQVSKMMRPIFLSKITPPPITSREPRMCRPPSACVRARARACVHACERACVRACVRAAGRRSSSRRTMATWRS
jgi:hypothetical protein